MASVDVGDDLNGGAQIVAAALLGDDVGIDAARGDVVGSPRGDPGEPLVVAEVEVRFGAVVGDVDLAVLVGAHGAGVDVEIGVQLAEPDRETARLQERAKSCRCQAFSERGDHAAGYEYEPGHGLTMYNKGPRLQKLAGYTVTDARATPSEDRPRPSHVSSY